MGSKLKEMELLDFGCGLGHLYKFIKGNGLLESWGIHYEGTDINPDFITEASKKFPAAKFTIKDDGIYSRKFDYVVCSGLYNLKFSEDFDIAARYKDELSKLFNCAQNGLAVNFQTQRALPLIPERLREGEMKRFYFHDTKKVLEDLKTITEKIMISNNYLPGDYDVTFYLLK